MNRPRQMMFWPHEYLDDLVDFWHFDTEVDTLGFTDFMCHRLNWSPEEVESWVAKNEIPHWWLKQWFGL